MPRRKIETITTWRTSDGALFDNSDKAQKRQEILDLAEFIMQNEDNESIALRLAAYMIAHQKELFEILGFDPRDC